MMQAHNCKTVRQNNKQPEVSGAVSRLFFSDLFVSVYLFICWADSHGTTSRNQSDILPPSISPVE